MFENVIRTEVVGQGKKKSPLIFWHKANFSINLLDTIEEFKQQEQFFVRRGLARRKNNIGEPSRLFDLDGVRYTLKWYVFSPEPHADDNSAVADIDCAPCPLYLFIGNVIQAGYAYVQLFEEGPVPAEALAPETRPAGGDVLVMAAAQTESVV